MHGVLTQTFGNQPLLMLKNSLKNNHGHILPFIIISSFTGFSFLSNGMYREDKWWAPSKVIFECISSNFLGVQVHLQAISMKNCSTR